jgi:hypothetical protein
MASSFFPTIFKHILEGTVNLTTAGQDPSTGKPVKIMLLKDTYTFSALHNDVADIVAHEVSGTGYERKVIGVTLTQEITGASDATAGCLLEFALSTVATWPGASFETQGAAMFLDGEAAEGDRRLLYYFDFGSKQVVSSGTFSLTSPNPQPKLRRYNSGS